MNSFLGLGESLREVGVIWSAELWRTVRSARIVVLLLLYLMFAAMTSLVVRGIANTVSRQVDAQVQVRGDDKDGNADADGDSSAEQVARGKEAARKQFVSAFFADDEAMAEALMAIPLVLLVVFKSSLRFLPLFIAIMGFDQISGEVGPRSIRYLTVRSRRSSVLLGKFLSQATLLAALMLLVDLGLCLHAWVAETDFSTTAMLATFVRFWLSAVVFSLAYLALTTLCSTLFRQPAISLVVNFMALFASWLFALVGEASTPPAALAYLRYVSVWHFASGLLHPEFSHYALAALAHLGFTLAFLGSGHWVLQRRDL